MPEDTPQKQTPAPAPANELATNASPAAPPAKGGGLKGFINKNRKLLAALLAVVIIGGGAAAAYFGFIAPKADNLFTQALRNSLKEKRPTAEGQLVVDEPGEEEDFTVTFKAASDADKQAGTFEATLTSGGVSVPAEIRMIGEKTFIKIGTETSVEELAAVLPEETAALLRAYGSGIAGKWISLSELTQASGGNACTVEQTAMTDAEIDQLVDLYEKNQFIAVKSSGGDTINGRAATKVELNLANQGDEKIKGFVNGLPNLPYFTRTTTCFGTNLGQAFSTGFNQGFEQAKERGESGEAQQNFQVHVWIDQATKTIVKIEISNQSQGGSFKMTINFSYDADVKVEEPTDTISIMEALNVLAPLLFGGFGEDSTLPQENPFGPTIEL